MAITDNGIATLAELNANMFTRNHWSLHTIIPFKDDTICPPKSEVRNICICAINDAYQDEQLVPFAEIAKPLSVSSYTLVINATRLLTLNATNDYVKLNNLTYRINYGDGIVKTYDLDTGNFYYPLTNNKYTFTQEVHVTNALNLGGIVFDTVNASATVYRSDGLITALDSSEIKVSFSGNQYTIELGTLIINPDLPPIEMPEAAIEFIAEIPYSGYMDLYPVEIKIDGSLLTSENHWLLPGDGYCTPTGQKPSFMYYGANVGETIYIRLVSGFGTATGQAGVCSPSKTSTAASFPLGSSMLTSEWYGIIVTAESMSIPINYTMWAGVVEPHDNEEDDEGNIQQ